MSTPTPDSGSHAGGPPHEGGPTQGSTYDPAREHVHDSSERTYVSHDATQDSHDTYDAHGTRTAGYDATQQRTTIPRPDDEQVVVRAGEDVVGAHHRRFDLLATIAGALAALGTLVLLSSLVGAAVGTIGYQTGVDGEDLSVGGLIAGLVVLFLSCLVGGWVAGRIARHRGGLHGLVAVLWLILLAAILAGLAALAGDEWDVRERVGLPDWFSDDALTGLAIATGIGALLLALLGGWLGGKLGERHRDDDTVEVVETRRKVRDVPGGIGTTGDRR